VLYEYEFSPGASIGGYAIRQAIGRGGGGEVYRARDMRLQRDVALKLLARTDSSDEGVRRVREARAAAQLNHRGIAAIHDILDVDGRPCIVMEYVAGQSLSERLRTQTIDTAAAVAIGIEMADAVAHAHVTGIVHCDLKPANMRFAADGSLKILDFGLARRPASDKSTHPGSAASSSTEAISGLSGSSLEALALGTPGYMSPEQLLGESIDRRTDVYTMGVVLYEMVAGRLPFHVDPANDMATAVAVLSTPLPDLPREVPRGLRRIILKCLSRRPEDRYPSGVELRDALRTENMDTRFMGFKGFKGFKGFTGFVWFVALCALAPLTAQQKIDADINAKIRSEENNRSEIMRTLHMLTDVYGPRMTGTPSLKAAGEWATKQMESWGFSNAHLEPWDFGHPGWVNERFTGHITSPVKDQLTCEVLAWTPGTNGTITAQAVEMDLPERPTQAELTSFLESQKARVNGRIVLAGKPVFVPVNLNPPARRRPDDQVKAQYDPNNPNAGQFGGGRGRGDQPPPPPMPANEIARRVDEFLVVNGARMRINDAGREHGQIIAFNNRTFDETKTVPTVVMRNEDYGRIARILADGTPVELEFNIVNRLFPEGRTAYNAIVELPGSDKKDEVVMLGGHLDSWHSATGATDNAVGVATMMEAARLLKVLGVQPRRTIRVAMWSGEEQGLLGSQAYVKEHFGSFESQKPEFAKLVAYLNIDSGTGRARGASVFGPSSAADIVRQALAPFADLGVAGAVATRSRMVGGTDSTSFNNAGLAGIGFGQDPIEYNTHTHHTNLDNYERVIEKDVKDSAIAIAATLYQLVMRDQPLPRFAAADMPAPVKRETQQ
jgi:carboxypeptidase Q